MYNFLLDYWKTRSNVTEAMIYNAVKNGAITEEEYEEIINTRRDTDGG